ncbi:MAP kinase-interacting serine/threonine-protein kinase 1-like [Aplysia californica]|uniref:MAP kinase-interacting serine/threonine-protein kinase 1-like n=1 Tax=Aplysia californica TaxID=6500 RepID=A0ABM0JIM1_APLCA|nr:MAP kinase-interacting serine/threonine-protein kinase 1-like [Aplysia californica]XP_012935787.1 MAP kinase-interacting serine/threonine-protein kinase 1-like [Aplysia californica]
MATSVCGQVDLMRGHPFLTTDISSDLAIQAHVCEQFQRMTVQSKKSEPESNNCNDDVFSIPKINEVCKDGVLRTSSKSTHSNDAVLCTSISRRACDSSGTYDSCSSKLKEKHTKVKEITFAKFRECYEPTGQNLGRGAHGSVYSFQNRESGAEYAVKIIKTRDNKSRRKVKKEIDICQRYNNYDNFINLVEFCEVGSSFFLVFDKMEGGDLGRVLESRGHLSETEAARIISTIAHALHTLHNDGVAHRDIKLENILCKKSGEVTPLVVGDFGIASDPPSERDPSKGDLTKTALTSPAGTRLYMAPEVFALLRVESLASYDTRCDMWSLGVLIYKMLFGVMPFRRGCDEHRRSMDLSCDACEVVLYQDIRHGDYRFPENAGESYSNSALDLIQHLLVVDPQARYSAAEVLQHPFLTINMSGDLTMPASMCGYGDRMTAQSNNDVPSALKTDATFNSGVLRTFDTNATSSDDSFFWALNSYETCSSSGTFDSS